MGGCTGSIKKENQQQQVDPRRFSKQDIKQFYRFGKILGSGSFGTVRLAYHILEEQNGRKSKEFAVKSICKKTLGDQFYLIQRELDILTELDHPNIIRFFETYEDEQYYYFVMEYCSGGELFERIAKRGTFTEEQAAYMMNKLFSAIEYLHSKNIAHRDLKPENLLLNSIDTFDVKIIDFGLSKKYGDKKMKAKSSQVGTPLYVAPECDNWSLGCIMYVLLSGETPFYSSNQQMLAGMIRFSPVQFLGREWLSVSQDAKELIIGLLHKDPQKRTTCQSALQSNWITKHTQFSKLRSSLIQLPSNSIMCLDEGMSTIKLLNFYANTSRFKKESLKILLNQMKESEIKDLQLKFECLDEDANGVITVSDLRQLMGTIGLEQTEQDINKLIKNIMYEHQSPQIPHIKYSEFLAATLNSKEFLSKEKLRLLFNQFDTRQKGYIEMQDLKHSIEREGRILSDQKLFEIFDEISPTSSGKLDFSGFASMMQKDVIMDEIQDEINEDVLVNIVL